MSLSLSTTEVEYVAVSDATKEAIRLVQLLQNSGEEFRQPIPLHIDNQNAIRLLPNPEYHCRT